MVAAIDFLEVSHLKEVFGRHPARGHSAGVGWLRALLFLLEGVNVIPCSSIVRSTTVEQQI